MCRFGNESLLPAYTRPKRINRKAFMVVTQEFSLQNVVSLLRLHLFIYLIVWLYRLGNLSQSLAVQTLLSVLSIYYPHFLWNGCWNLRIGHIPCQLTLLSSNYLYNLGCFINVFVLVTNFCTSHMGMFLNYVTFWFTIHLQGFSLHLREEAYTSQIYADTMTNWRV